MYSTGIDIVMVSRITPWVQDKIMLNNVFTENEKKNCLIKRHPHKELAAFFAVKEAFMKAMGTGWSSGVAWKDVEVCAENERLFLRLHNKADELCGSKKVFVSASCANDLAVAFVVVDGA